MENAEKGDLTELLPGGTTEGKGDAAVTKITIEEARRQIKTILDPSRGGFHLPQKLARELEAYPYTTPELLVEISGMGNDQAIPNTLNGTPFTRGEIFPTAKIDLLNLDVANWARFLAVVEGRARYNQQNGQGPGDAAAIGEAELQKLVGAHRDTIRRLGRTADQLTADLVFLYNPNVVTEVQKAGPMGAQFLTGNNERVLGVLLDLGHEKHSAMLKMIKQPLDKKGIKPAEQLPLAIAMVAQNVLKGREISQRVQDEISLEDYDDDPDLAPFDPAAMGDNLRVKWYLRQLNSSNLNVRRKAVEALSKIDHPRARLILDVRNKLEAVIPKGANYRQEEKILELLPKALELRDKGNEFTIREFIDSEAERQAYQKTPGADSYSLDGNIDYESAKRLFSRDGGFRIEVAVQGESYFSSGDTFYYASYTVKILPLEGKTLGADGKVRLTRQEANEMIVRKLLSASQVQNFDHFHATRLITGEYIEKAQGLFDKEGDFIVDVTLEPIILSDGHTTEIEVGIPIALDIWGPPHDPAALGENLIKKGINFSASLLTALTLTAISPSIEEGSFLQYPAEARAKSSEEMELYAASYDGDIAKVKELLKRGVNVNMKDSENGMTPLMIASANGRTTVVQTLLEKYADVSARANDGETALLMAATYGYTDIVKILLKEGAQVNLKTIKEGLTPLIAASFRGHTGVVQALLAADNIDVDLRNTKDEVTALMVAAQNGHADIVEALLAKGTNTNLKAKNGATAFALACEYGHLNIVKLLLDKNPEIDSRLAESEATPLIIAAQNGHTEVVKILLAKGAEVNTRMDTGTTALIIASQHGRTEVVRILSIASGVDLDVRRTQDEATALIIASQNGHTEIVQTLLANGANVNLKTDNGATALMLASLDGHLAIVQALLDREGAEVDAKDTSQGRTALMLASFQGHTDVVRALLAEGADVNLQNNDGITALMIASQRGHTAIVRLLLANDAEVNLKSIKQGGTALIAASLGGHTEIVQILLANGADASIQDINGETALSLATKPEIIDLLKKAKITQDASVVNPQLDAEFLKAVESGDLQKVQDLLDQGANVNAKVADHPLLRAAREDAGAANLRRLLGKSVSEGEIVFDRTALMIASKNGHLGVVQLLVEKGANVNAKDEDGKTALDIAETPEIKEYLRSNGAKSGSDPAAMGRRITNLSASLLTALTLSTVSPEITLGQGLSVEYDQDGEQFNNGILLRIAATVGNTAKVEELLRQGVDVNTKEPKTGTTAIMPAALMGHLDVVKILVENGANVGIEAAILMAKTPEIKNYLLNKGRVASVKSEDFLNAIAGGKLELVSLFIRSGANVNMKDSESGFTALMLASSAGHADIVKLLLENRADVDARYEMTETDSFSMIIMNRSTALMSACLRGHLDVVKILVDHHANINAQDILGHTALDLAKTPEIKEYLRSKGAKSGSDPAALGSAAKKAIELAIVAASLTLTPQDELVLASPPVSPAMQDSISFMDKLANSDALAQAAINGDISKVRALLKEANIDVNLRFNDDLTALMFASRNGHANVVRALLDKGAEVNVKDNKGYTPLMSASAGGYTEVVHILLTAKDIDVNATMHVNKITGVTALMFASLQGHVEIVGALLEKGANVNLKESEGNTALSYAEAKGNKEIVDLLEKAEQKSQGAGVVIPEASKAPVAVEAPTAAGETQIQQPVNPQLDAEFLKAVKSGDIVKVQDILNRGADINAKDEFGRSALIVASQEGKLEVVQLLIDKRVDVNTKGVKDNEGMTPLMGASATNHLGVAKFLIEKGADVNANASGHTALMMASLGGHTDIVKLLIEHEANVNVKGGSLEFTPLMSAVAGNHLEVVKILIENGAKIDTRTRSGLTPFDLAETSEIKAYLKSHGVKKGNPADVQALLSAAEAGNIDRAQDLLNKGVDVNAGHLGVTALIKASYYGHLDVVKLLLNKGAEVNSQPVFGSTALIEAARKGHIEIVKILIERGAEVNAKNENSNTALMLASGWGYRDVVEFLIKHEANVNATNIVNDTALMYASINGHFDIVKLLVENGAEVNAQAPGGTALDIAETPEIKDYLRSKGAKSGGDPAAIGLSAKKTAELALAAGLAALNCVGPGCASHKASELGITITAEREESPVAPQLLQGDFLKAAESGDVQKVQALLDQDAEVNLRDNFGDTALTLASRNGHIGVVQALLAKDAEMDLKQTRYEETALIMASRNGHIDVVQALLEKGANVDLRDNGGNTALIWASEKGRTEVVKLLIERGAAVNAKNKDDRTALMLASASGRFDVVKLLIAKGADVNAKSLEGYTALMLTSEGGHTEIVQTLLANGVNVNLRDNNEKTPLMFASKGGHIDVVQILLAKGADPNAQDSDGETALIMALQYQHIDVVQALLEKGANVDLRDNGGNTALIWASYNGPIANIQALLEKGANINAKDNKGKTALDRAQTSETEKYLRSKGAKSGSDPAAMGGKLVNFSKILLTTLIISGVSPATVLGIDPTVESIFPQYSLIIAAGKGDIEKVNELLALVTDVNIQDPFTGATALMQASQNGHKEVVIALLNKDANVNMRAENGTTALMLASKNGHAEIVHILMDKWADVNVKEPTTGGTPLIMSSGFGHTETVRVLLTAKDIDVNVKGAFGITALMIASQQGHTEVVRALLVKGADVNLTDDKGATALSLAKKPEIIDLLKKAKTTPSAGAETPPSISQDKLPEDLFNAVMAKDIQRVQALLAQGANVNAQDVAGTTPLMEASRWHHPDVVRLLIERGANIHARDMGGSTELMVASIYGSFESVKLLVESGAEINSQDNNGLTALDVAKTDEITAYLKSKGAKNVSELAPLPGEDIVSQLSKAIMVNNIQKVRTILDQGIDVNAKMDVGGTIFEYACFTGHLEIVKLLIAKGGNIHSGDALISAADMDHLDVVKLLVEKGANVNAKEDHTGQTALDYAKTVAMQNYLRSKGAKSGSDPAAIGEAQALIFGIEEFLKEGRFRPFEHFGGTRRLGRDGTVDELLDGHTETRETTEIIYPSDQGLNFYKSRHRRDQSRADLVRLMFSPTRIRLIIFDKTTAGDVTEDISVNLTDPLQDVAKDNQPKLPPIAIVNEAAANWWNNQVSNLLKKGIDLNAVAPVRVMTRAQAEQRPGIEFARLADPAAIGDFAEASVPSLRNGKVRVRIDRERAVVAFSYDEEDGKPSGLTYIMPDIPSGVVTAQTIADEIVQRLDAVSGRPILSRFDEAYDAVEKKIHSSAPGSEPAKPVGGINLDPSLLDLQIKRDGNGVPLPLLMQPIGDMKIEGFFPVIINITPVSLPLLLGLNTETPVDNTEIEQGKNKFYRDETEVVSSLN